MRLFAFILASCVVVSALAQEPNDGWTLGPSGIWVPPISGPVVYPPPADATPGKPVALYLSECYLWYAAEAVWADVHDDWAGAWYANTACWMIGSMFP